MTAPCCARGSRATSGPSCWGRIAVGGFNVVDIHGPQTRSCAGGVAAESEPRRRLIAGCPAACGARSHPVRAAIFLSAGAIWGSKMRKTPLKLPSLGACPTLGQGMTGTMRGLRERFRRWFHPEASLSATTENVAGAAANDDAYDDEAEWAAAIAAAKARSPQPPPARPPKAHDSPRREDPAAIAARRAEGKTGREDTIALAGGEEAEWAAALAAAKARTASVAPRPVWDEERQWRAAIARAKARFPSERRPNGPVTPPARVAPANADRGPRTPEPRPDLPQPVSFLAGPERAERSGVIVTREARAAADRSAPPRPCPPPVPADARRPRDRSKTTTLVGYELKRPRQTGPSSPSAPSGRLGASRPGP